MRVGISKITWNYAITWKQKLINKEQFLFCFYTWFQCLSKTQKFSHAYIMGLPITGKTIFILELAPGCSPHLCGSREAGQWFSVHWFTRNPRHQPVWDNHSGTTGMDRHGQAQPPRAHHCSVGSVADEGINSLAPHWGILLKFLIRCFQANFSYW